MALDPGTQRRSLSPASSEGSSALASRARAKDQEGGGDPSPTLSNNSGDTDYAL